METNVTPKPEPSTDETSSAMSRLPARRRREVVLATVATVIGLAAGVGLGRATATVAPRPSDLAPAAVGSMLDRRIAAVNSGDAREIARFYGPYAVLEERDQDPAALTTDGPAIARRLAAYAQEGFRINGNGTAIQQGDYVAETATWLTGGGILVYELGPTGVIEHQWVIGGSL